MTRDNDGNHWRWKSKCLNEWELFDSVEDENGKDSYPHLEEAKALCMECPVFEECRLDARLNKEPQGIRAGEIMNGRY